MIPEFKLVVRYVYPIVGQPKWRIVQEGDTFQVQYNVFKQRSIWSRPIEDLFGSGEHENWADRGGTRETIDAAVAFLRNLVLASLPVKIQYVTKDPIEL